MILHQARKDLHLLKWILAAWVLLNVAFYGTVLIGVHGTAASVADSGPLATWFAALRGMLIATFFAFPVLIVQNDPAVVTTAGWLTRPLSWRGVVAAKLLLVIPLFAVLPAALDLATMVVGGVPIRSAAGPALASLAAQAAWVMGVVALAAVTANLAQFVVAVLLELLWYEALFYVGRIPWSRSYFMIPSFYTYSPPALSLETRQAVFIGAVILGGLALLALAYRRRSQVQGAVMAGILPIAIGLVTLTWPWELAEQLQPRLASSIDVSVLPVSFTDASMMSRSRAYGACGLEATLAFSNVPDGQSVQPLTWSGRLTSRSGQWDLARALFTMPDLDGQEVGQEGRARTQVLGGEVLTGRRNPPAAPFSFSVSIPVAGCRASKDEAAALEGAMDVAVIDHTARTTRRVAVDEDYALENGVGRIVSVERYARGVTVIARETGLDTRQDRFVHRDYALQDLRLRQVILQSRRTLTSAPFVVQSALVPAAQHLGATWQEVDFDWPDDPAFDADAWLRDARFVVVESRRIGMAERRVSVDGIVLSRLKRRQEAK